MILDDCELKFCEMRNVFGPFSNSQISCATNFILSKIQPNKRCHPVNEINVSKEMWSSILFFPTTKLNICLQSPFLLDKIIESDLFGELFLLWMRPTAFLSFSLNFSKAFVLSAEVFGFLRKQLKPLYCVECFILESSFEAFWYEISCFSVCLGKLWVSLKRQ